MSAAAPTTLDAPPAERAADAAVNYWSVVAVQLRKNRVAMAAYRLVLGLILTAVAAPVIALNVPYVLKEGSAWSSPFMTLLFDRFVFPGGVDVFFNLLLLVGPAWALAGLVGRSARAAGERRESRWSSLGVIAWGACLLLWTLLVALAAWGGARLAGGVYLGAGVPGAAVLLWAHLQPRTVRARRTKRARIVCVVLLLGAFTLLMGPLRDTNSLVDWRERTTEVEKTGRGFAVFPPIHYHPDNVGEYGSGPVDRSLKAPDGENVLGCDLNGRDVAARLVFGTRISMTIGLIAVSIFIVIGVILGSLAGFYQGWVDLVISRMIEVMICFPTLFLLLTIVAVFESRSIFLIMGAIGLVGWPGVSRLVRGEFLRQRGLDYVTAAQSQGLPERRIIFGHVLPNCVGPVLVSATFGVASAILLESTLAFLGLGDTTASSWGQMLSSGRSEGQWHLILVPGFAIFFVVTVFNLLGEGLRDALDPKLRR